MCGRFTLTLEISALQMAFDLGAQSVDWKPNYNIVPSSKIPVVTNQNPTQVELLHWGLVPSWAKDASISAKLINARSETAHDKPSFRTPFRSKRCLIFADGFYEWKRGVYKGSKKVPYYFRRQDKSPFVFAGLWDYWPGNENAQALSSCTILTCSPNNIVAPIHDRMPVIFNWNQGKEWLSDKKSEIELRSMLVSVDEIAIEGYEVSSIVNRPNNNSPTCIEPQKKLTLF
ncbi:MAG: SOS response-associated peptidase [Anaerolineaceae bacterium]|nr:SOS response-associated peptidase [Anaerolineaceae bacterium]